MNNSEVPLSKWWTTKSCRDAFARVEQVKREKLDRLRKIMADKKARLEKEANEWEPVEN